VDLTIDWAIMCKMYAHHVLPQQKNSVSEITVFVLDYGAGRRGLSTTGLLCFALCRLSQAKGEVSMNSDPKKTDVDSGNQITGATELSDAELSKVTGGDSAMGVLIRGAAQLPGSGIGKALASSSVAGTAAGVSGGSTTDPKPD
jgi:hypothetical protein